MLVVYASYALGFWFGAGVVLGEYLPDLHTDFSIGDMLIVSYLYVSVYMSVYVCQYNIYIYISVYISVYIYQCIYIEYICQCMYVSVCMSVYICCQCIYVSVCIYRCSSPF